MTRSQAENTEKKNQKERRVMSQKERVDLIEVDLLDMCKYILSKWVFILIGMVVFAGAGFGYAKVKSVTEYSSKMQVYVTVPKTSDKVHPECDSYPFRSLYSDGLRTCPFH